MPKIRPKNNVRPDINALKVLGAILIVLYHSNAFGSSFHYSGLLVFCIISAALHKEESTPLRETIRKRFSRLGRPWIIWSLIYAAVNISLQKALFPNGSSNIEKILCSTSIHLWYLPYLFVALFALDWIKKKSDQKHLSIALLAIAATLILSAPLWRVASLDIGEPWAQYIHALPALLIGAALPGLPSDNSYPKTAISLAIAGMAGAVVWRVSGVGLTYLFASLLICAILSINYPKPAENKINHLAQITFAVYLIHPLAIMLARQVIKNQTLIGIASAIGCFVFCSLVKEKLPRAFKEIF